MNLLDIVIVALLVLSAVWGAMSGVAIQLGSALGLWSGLLVGSLAAPRTAGLATSASQKLVVTALTVVFTTVAFLAVGEFLGRKLSTALDRADLGPADSTFGAVLSAIATLLTVWVLATSLATAPSGSLGRQIQGSSILLILDQELPPVPAFAARLGRVVDPLGFPRVFAGLERGAAKPVSGPTPAEEATAVAAARGSTVKIEGKGCGGILDGSGYVAAADLVVTNAHVIAGIRAPMVIDDNGRHAATPIVFDPDVDLAVLRVPDLAHAPLALAEADAQRGAVGAVLGYPGGGDFTEVPAAVAATYPAVGRDIYGSGLVTRNVYELQADVRPGNSGGPLVAPDGRVLGVVFARSISAAGVGYALTASEVRPRLAAAAARPGGVDTGSCAAP